MISSRSSHRFAGSLATCGARRFSVSAVIATLLLSSAAHAQNSQTFNGNGGAGFGGILGTGSIKVSSTTSAVTFLFTPSSSFAGNDVVVYLDTKAGGVGNTSTFTDSADGGRESISGFNPTNPSRSLLTFSSGFTADYAIDFDNNNFVGVFDLSTPSNFGFITGVTPTSGGPYTITLTDAQIGLTPGSTLKFDASLISTSAYRSNETVGASTTTPGSAGDAPNAGFSGSTTFTVSNSFVTNGSAPEPGGLALFAVGAMSGIPVALRFGAATRRRCKAT